MRIPILNRSKLNIIIIRYKRLWLALLNGKGEEKQNVCTYHDGNLAGFHGSMN